MLTKIWNAIDGWKTHGIAVTGILIAVVSHFWGPFNVGSIQIPQFAWTEVWTVVWGGGLFSALHAKSN